MFKIISLRLVDWENHRYCLVNGIRREVSHESSFILKNVIFNTVNDNIAFIWQLAEYYTIIPKDSLFRLSSDGYTEWDILINFILVSVFSQLINLGTVS